MTNQENKRNMLLKGGLVLALSLILLIPLQLVRGLIQERQIRKSEVLEAIGSTWGLEQQIKGPVLAVHYVNRKAVTFRDNAGKAQTRTEEYPDIMYLAADQCDMQVLANPEIRKRSIFETVLYEAQASLNGSFAGLADRMGDLKEADINWEETELILGLSDLRGLKGNPDILVNGKPVHFEGSVALDVAFGQAVKAPLRLSKKPDSLSFTIDFSVKGSGRLSFVPLAKNNFAQVSSSWESPSFDGSFLPDNRVVDSSGFKAEWRISQLNRNLPDRWKKADLNDYEATAFGVSLIQPNDNYQKSERSVKYGVLIIALTFLSFFFVELLTGQRVHTFQYVLIGSALCIFYTLLVSISEYLMFNTAYAISSVMVLAMIWLYARSLLGKLRLSTLLTSVLTGLYIYVFSIIQLEDSALLAGSLGLFFILALTMYFSRKIDWGNL